jgi:hypothetical protein
MRERVRITNSLLESGGSHLILVRYSADHNVHREWVYNNADIDASKIVWARDMGADRNRELVNYFAGRKVWLLEPDKSPQTLIPYTEPAAAAQP